MNKFSFNDNVLYGENVLHYAQEGDKNAFDDKQLCDAFGKSLKELREYCGLSTVKISEAVDIAQPTISSYENRTRTPSILQAIRITAFFGLTVEEFIICGLEDSPYDIAELYEKRKKDL